MATVSKLPLVDIRVEADHRERYRKLLEMVESGTVFTRDEPIRWKCSVCGYVHEGTEPPAKCPCCSHPRDYYEPETISVKAGETVLFESAVICEYLDETAPGPRLHPEDPLARAQHRAWIEVGGELARVG